MRLLLLLTSHNSLSQRLTTVLDELATSPGPRFNPTTGCTANDIFYTIEYALSEDAIVQSVEKVKPDIIIGAFLTKKVPKAVWSKVSSAVRSHRYLRWGKQ